MKFKHHLLSALIAMPLAAALAAAIVHFVPQWRADPSSRVARLRDLEGHFASLADKAGPSVVAIQTRHRLAWGNRSARRGMAEGIVGSGSGFVYAHGLILTNEHVVHDGDEITVTWSDGKAAPAEIVAADLRSDLAVLCVARTDTPPLDLGQLEQVRSGQWVLVLGNPLGSSNGGEPALAVGVISAVGRSLPGLHAEEGRHYADLIQVSAPVVAGNSGGPVINLDGKVVGIMTAAARPDGDDIPGVAFAIPFNARTLKIIGQLAQGKPISYGYLGVHLALTGGVDRAKTGAAVLDVEQGSPAQKAGIRSRDMIVSFQGRQVVDTDQFIGEIAASPAGSEVRLTVQRGGQKVDLKALLAERPRPETRPARGAPGGP